MAVFNPSPPPTNDPTYGRESRAFESDVIVDRTYEGLFKGLGNLVDVTAKGLDFAVKKDIDLNLYKEIDEERDAFGVGDTAAMAASAGSPLDKTKEGVFRGEQMTGEMNHLGPQVERLTQAHQAGKLSDRYYHARLESLVRSFRARYPGYREYIDQKVGQITGVVPANALRRDILQELDALSGKGDSAQQRKQNLQKELGQFVDPATEAQFASNQISPEEYIFRANKKKRYISDMGVKSSEYDLLGKVDNWNDKKVVENMNQRGRVILKDAIGTFTNILGVEGFEQFQDKLTKIATGELKMSEQEIAIMGQRYGSFLTNVRTALSQQLEAPNSAGSFPPREVVNKQVKELMSDLESVGAHITNDPKDMQVVGTTMRRLKALETDDQLSMLLDNKFGNIMRTASAARKIAGEQFVAPALNTALQERGRILSDVILPTAIDQTEYIKKFNKPFTMSEAVTIAAEAGENNPAMGDQIVRIAETLADPKISPEGVKKLAQFAFSPANMDFIQKHIPPADQTKVYARLTKPDIIKKIMATGDQQVIENFKFWAKNEFTSLFAKHINDAQALEWNEQIKLDYNTNTNTFSLDVPEGLPGGSKRWYDSYQPLIKELNEGISTFKNVLAMDKQDVPSYMTALLAQHGYRKGAEAPPGIMKSMWDLMYPRMQELVQPLDIESSAKRTGRKF